VNHVGKYATCTDYEMLDPEVNLPPKGVDLHVLTIGGVVVRSPWKDNAGFVAWYPFFKVPAWAKARMNKAYQRSIQATEEGVQP